MINAGLDMPGAQTADDATVDVVFPLEARAMPRDHAQALQQALCAQLPWLLTEPISKEWHRMLHSMG